MTKVKTVDALDEMSKFTKPEMEFFMLLKNSLIRPYKTLVVRLNTKGFNGTTKQHVKIGYQRLYKKDLVRRVKRGVYMINPSMILMTDEDRSVQETIWINCEPFIKPKPKPIRLLYAYDSNIIDISDTSAEVFPLDSYDTYGEQEYVTRDRVIKYGIKVNHSN